MATLAQGTVVVLDQGAADALQYPPASQVLIVAVHDSALKAPADGHTQVLHVSNGAVDWVGALGEDLLTRQNVPEIKAARAACAKHLLHGARMWEVVRPGALLKPGVPRPLSSVYDGSDLRPWVVLGETSGGDIIAAPLNDPRANPKWWTPIIAQGDMDFPGNNKNAQVELAHLWTFPSSLAREGAVKPAGRPTVEKATKGYFGL